MGSSHWETTADQLILAGTLTIGDGYRAKNSELTPEGLPFARAGNINDGFNFNGADRFPLERLSSVGEKISRSGDVVFTSKGTVGRFAFVIPSIERFVYSPQLCYWRSLNNSKLNPNFLYFWMKSPEFLNQISYLKGQTDMADYVSLRDQKKIKITIPPIHIQVSIAETLSALDDKIALNRQTNATLEAIAQALFKSWFVDFDPVRAKMEGREPEGMDETTAALFPSELVESELGLIPKGWAVKNLDQVADYLNGLALQKFPPESDDSYLPVIKIAQLRQGHTTGADKASRNIKQQYIIRDGDVLFSWSGSLEVEIWCSGEGALNQHLFKVTSEHFPRWLYFLWTRYHLATFREIAANKATTMGHIQRHHLTHAKTVIPPNDLLVVLSEVLDPLIADIVARNLESRSLANIRDSLLPKLISGQLRIPEVEEVIGEAL